MATVSDEQVRLWEEHRRKEEEAELSLVRKLVDFVRLWQSCENRQCRRAQGCRDARACRTKHAEGILWWKRNVWAPYLEKRYPTVQWGAPASVVEAQYEAALEAEREEEARRQGRAPATQSDSVSTASKRGKKKRVPVHSLYDPRDV